MPFGYIGALPLALLVGLSLGALGSGGSIITTPVLVYVAHVPPERAVSMSLVVVGFTSLIGAAMRLRGGKLAVKPALMFSLTGMAGSFIGSRFTHALSSRSLLLIFSGIMICAAIAMWRGPARSGARKPQSDAACLAAGFVVGLLTGFLGVGGGFLIVPALVFFAGLDPRIAAGTSLAVISINCVTGLLGQLRFVQIDWILTLAFVTVALAGMALGIQSSGRLSEKQLRAAFSCTVFVMAVAIAVTNILGWTPHQ